LTGEIQLNKLLEALDLQLDTYNDPTDLIGVVSGRIDDCEVIKARLDATRFGEISKLFHSDIRNRSFPKGIRICVVPVQACKGLEFRALHWLMPNRDSYIDLKERAYTVVTRAKSSLTVYHNENLPGYLAGAFPADGHSIFEDDK
jgi:DNA helicase IV